MHEILVGFDARILWSEQKPAQAAEEPRDIRVLIGMPEPFSVSTSLWPSYLDRHQLPEWTGPIGKTWDDLMRMCDYLQKHDYSLKSDCLRIAVSAFRECETAEDWYLAHWNLTITPSLRNPAWPLLGYDVADSSLSTVVLSGLFMGQTSESEWKAHLNEHGLFKERDYAFAYRDYAEETYAERDPLEVFGLYLIEDRHY